MKITKRQLKRIIREEKRNLVKEAIRGTIHGDPNKESFLDITMDAVSQADYKRAAGAIMDSYFLDDYWPEEEQALIDMLASSRQRATSPASVMEIEAIADDWMSARTAGTWLPKTSSVQETTNVKITKRQLRRIIKEEKAKILNENYPIGGDDPSPEWEAFKAAAYDVAVGFIDAGMEADGVIGAMQDEIESIISEMDIDNGWEE